MSDKAKHTAKWEVNNAFIVEHPYLVICEVNQSLEKWHEKAHLLAASPTLYLELDAMLAALEAGETITIQPGSVKANKIALAIAAATGEGK